MSCKCQQPLPSPNPRTTSCNRCALPIDGPGISNDDELRDFFNCLESGMSPPKAKPDKKWLWLRQLSEDREREGREKFGLAYLQHDYLENVAEEAADIIVYSYLRHLRTLREAGEDRNLDVLLQGCKEVSDGLRTLLNYPAKNAGSP
jgi:hypothetical protein